MKKLLLSISLLSITFVNAQEEKKPYSLRVNLQQESIEPYSTKVHKEQSPYHYKKKEEHEIKFGRPILDNNFDDPKVFFTFYKEQVNRFLKNYENLLKADLNDKRRDKMIQIRRATLLDLEYAEYRARTIKLKNKELEYIQTSLHDNFIHLQEDYMYKMPKYIEAYRTRRMYKEKENFSKDETRLNYSIYKDEFDNFIKHIHPLVLDLQEQLLNVEKYLETTPKPNYKQKYLLNELYAIAIYKNNLYPYIRSSKQQSDAYIYRLNQVFIDASKSMEKNPKLTLKKYFVENNVEVELEVLMQKCTSLALKNSLELKSIDKFRTDVSLKNNVNKYLKFVQTSGKSTFKKVNSTIQKSKAITDIEIAKMEQTLNTYKSREKEYFITISTAFKDLLKKYSKESSDEAKEMEAKEIKRREQQEKLEERNKEKERKDYWKKRNL